MVAPNRKVVELKDGDAEKIILNIRRAKRYKPFADWYSDYKQNVALYRNEQSAWDELMPPRKWKHAGCYLNLVRLIGDSEVRRTMAKDPAWTAKAQIEQTQHIIQTPQGTIKQPRDNRKASDACTKVLNFGTRRARLLLEAQRAQLDGYLANVFWFKIGADNQVGDLTTSASFPEDHEKPNRSVEHGAILNATTRFGVPWVKRIPPHAIVEDPDATTWEEVNWLAQRVIRPYLDVVNDPRYAKAIAAAKKKGRSILPNLTQADLEYIYSKRQNDPRENTGEYFALWEYWQRIPDKTWSDGFRIEKIAIAENADANGPLVLSHTALPVDIGGFPFVRGTPNPDNDSLKGIPVVTYFKGANAMLIYIASMVTEWGARNLPKWMVSGLTTEEKKNLASGDLNVIVQVSGDARTSVAPFPLIPIPQELMGLYSMLRGFVDEQSMQSPAQRLLPTGVSAQETREVAGNAMEFVKSKRDNLKATYCELARKFLALQRWLLKDGTKYVIPNGQGGFLEFDKELLMADCELEYDWRASAESDPAVDAKLNQELLMILTQFAGGDVNVNRKAILERIVVGRGWEPEEIFLPPQEQPWDPNVEHMKILTSREPVMPNPAEDFTQTVPVHREFAALCTRNPDLQKAWLEGPDGQLPFIRLMAHIKASEQAAVAKGQGKFLGLQDGKTMPGGMGAGMGMGKGSGPEAMRPSTGLGNTGDMMSSAGRVAVPGMGNGRGIQ